MKNVQDDSREEYLANLFSLERNTSRIGWDARDQSGNLYEIKTTTRSHVSTARDLGFNHLKKWATRFWIIARGVQHPSEFVYETIYFLDPNQMAPWIQSIHERLNRDMKYVNQCMEYVNVFEESEDSKRKIENILEKGIKLNDPGIHWSYICQHGTLITSNYSEELKKLVDAFNKGNQNANASQA
jgi:hypothetical protein